MKQRNNTTRTRRASQHQDEMTPLKFTLYITIGFLAEYGAFTIVGNLLGL